MEILSGRRSSLPRLKVHHVPAGVEEKQLRGVLGVFVPDRSHPLHLVLHYSTTIATVRRIVRGGRLLGRLGEAQFFSGRRRLTRRRLRRRRAHEHAAQRGADELRRGRQDDLGRRLAARRGQRRAARRGHSDHAHPRRAAGQVDDPLETHLLQTTRARCRSR